MKRIALVLAGALLLTACGPEHVKDEVREVEIGQTLVDDGYGPAPYVPNTEYTSEAPELYVELKDTATGTIFKVDLGTECSQFPFPVGQRFLAKFDISAYKEKPADLYMTPYSDKVYGFLCPTV